MADVKWIKITTDIFDDDKVLLIESLPDADSIIVIWFKLLCLAGKQNNSGVFLLNDRIPYTDKMLATIFRRKESTVQLALQTFQQFGMIEIVDGVITIPNWGKHQNLDALERKTSYMREYMREYRAKQKFLAQSTSDSDDCKTNSKDNVSEADKNKSKNKSKEKEDISSDLSDESTDAPSQSEGSSKPKKKKSVAIFDTETHEYKLAAWLDKQIAGRMAYYKRRTDAQLQEWALVFNRMNRLDGIDWDTMRDVLMWSQSDDFWQRNILSADKFRKQFAKLADQMERDYRNG